MLEGGDQLHCRENAFTFFVGREAVEPGKDLLQLSEAVVMPGDLLQFFHLGVDEGLQTGQALYMGKIVPRRKGKGFSDSFKDGFEVVHVFF